MDLNATARPRGRFTRRQFLFGLGGLASAVAVGGAYMRLGEPHWLEVSRLDVAVSRDRAAPAVRVVQLSDFHASPVVSFEFIARAVALALEQRPDVVALTGDFFTNRIEEPARYAEILQRLARVAPTFACLGNHDGGPWTRAAGGNATIEEALALLRASNVTCLLQPGKERGSAEFPASLSRFFSAECQPRPAHQAAAQ